MTIRALVISASLPPFNDSSTLRLIGRVECFSEYDIEATFIGAEMPQKVENALLERLPTDSIILRTAPTAYDRTMAWLSRLPGGKTLTWAYGNVMYRIAAPDVRAGWDLQVVHLLQQSKSKSKSDIIVSSGGSHTAHIAGRHLAKKLNVPWVADLGDPWSLVDSGSWHNLLKAGRNRALELQTIPYASGLVFTTEATLAAYKAWLGDELPPTIILPSYGYNMDDFPDANHNKQRSGECIGISHIGTAHQGNRSLIPTIQALGSLEQKGALSNNYMLNIIGPHSQSFEEEAKRLMLHSVSFSGRVPYQESVDWINRSSVLIIVGNASPLQIPGKIYPYLGSGRPILYLAQLPEDQDPTAHLLAQFSGILFAQNSRDSIERALIEIDRGFDELAGEARHRLEMPALRNYESNVVSGRFAKFVKDLAIESMTINV